MDWVRFWQSPNSVEARFIYFHPEVRFAPPVTAGSSVKFLAAVKISPECKICFRTNSTEVLSSLREGVKKSGYSRVSFLWNFFGCVFYLRLWFYVFWNGFYARKLIFIQLQEFPTSPYCRCCSVTKRSDNSIAEALKALNIARIANAVQVTICLLVSTSVY